MSIEFIEQLRAPAPPAPFYAVGLGPSDDRLNPAFVTAFRRVSLGIAKRVLAAHAAAVEIDAIIESGHFRSNVEYLLDVVERNGLREDIALQFEQLDPAKVGSAVDTPPEVAQLVEEALRFLLARDAAWRTFIRALRGSGFAIPDADELAAESAGEPDPMAFLAEAPVPMARLMLAHYRGAVASFALAGALMTSPEHATVVELARLWRDGERAQLVLVASLPPAGVPLDLVPASERLDLAALRAEAEEEAERLRQLELAEAAGVVDTAEDLGLE